MVHSFMFSYSCIFISIFWAVTPCLESFVHGAPDGKRQEELKGGGKDRRNFRQPQQC